jgi:hypothetical protein
MLVLLVVSFLLTFLPITYMHFSSPQFVPHFISFSFLYCIQVDPIPGCETSSQTLNIECVKYNKSRKIRTNAPSIVGTSHYIYAYNTDTITTYNAKCLNISSSTILKQIP